MSLLATILPPKHLESKEALSLPIEQRVRCVPIKRLLRAQYRKQQVGEATLKFRVASDGIVRPVQLACSTPEIMFCQLLIGAGVLTDKSALEAMEESCLGKLSLIRTIGRKYKISRRTSLSICQLVKKLKAETLTFNEGVLATKHMCVFRTSLAEALEFVSLLAQQSIISFLQVVGLVSDEDLYRLTENNWIEPTRLAAMLVSQGILEDSVLRNATRLRYWLKKGEFDFERINKLLITCLRESIDVEYCTGDESLAA